MDHSTSPLPTTMSMCHLVAMPFPGRGHINPMMNLCKLLISRKPEILISFVLTEEWFGFIESDPKPDNICFRTIPNTIPPERLKAADFPGFYEAVMTKMEAPFEQLLDQLEQPVTAIIGDIEVRWAIGLGNRRNIPVAAFWTMSISFFSMLYHFDQLSREGHSPFDLLERVDYMSGISSLEMADLKTVFDKNDQRVMQLALDCISRVPKSQYLLFTSIYDLESQVTNTLRESLSFPVYPIGPAIPYPELKRKSSGSNSGDKADPDYIQWLDSQPEDSVLYVSLGSFLSVSSTQMDEIAAGLRNSGVRFVWVARRDASRLQEICGETGLVLPWCDQLRVLCHSSVGGFWSHCGWNSTLEAVFGGVPILTFPLFLDQYPNSNQIVEDWKIGWRVKRELGTENFVTKEEIADLVQSFMDLDSDEGKQLRNKARQIRDICRKATEEGGSSVINLDAFIRNISQKHCH
ncbi:hypothetical protein ACOSP7_024103 [Xanthoceras sorbifolium]|uniref:UDP-glycosyltransferase 87A1-like n=1 Tax=Xanthoceras sorbifolium TaxID=99658 RepID=A0ABQ8H9D0_9ROSI|nr:hypothetical protein JRO89_XS13G0209600 [Xanthoceras sorbifolium]